jgi:hypothetical protein
MANEFEKSDMSGRNKQIRLSDVRYRMFLLPAVLVLLVASAAFGLRGSKASIEQSSPAGRPAKIYPDYCGIVIPPNIAPLNFRVEEPGTDYFVRIYCKQSKPIELSGKTAKVVIPQGRWRELLNANRGEELHLDIFVKSQEGKWRQFSTITNTIAREDIDGYLVYRKIHPGHNILAEMGIYQRNLTNYDESPVLRNKSFSNGCVNCHSFCRNKTDNMLLQVRSPNKPSMLLIRDGIASNVDSRTGFSSKPMGHAAWHPSGKVIAFALYDVILFYHTARSEVRDALDRDSAMGYYIVDSKTIKTIPQLSDKEYLETWPCWSADGRYLYFSRAPKLWTGDKDPLDYYKKLKYDLVRISYDVDSDRWGELETVVSGESAGKSIVLPRISPDGRWLLFCMCNYGAWSGFQEDSDIYIVDLDAAQKTGKYEYRALEANSDKADYWKSWSSNSRWIVFSSKRDDGMFTKSYFSYIDANGVAHKPFVLPQKDPAFYDSFVKIYQMPELVSELVPVTSEGLAHLIRAQREPPGQVAMTSATPKADSGPGL